MNQPSMPGSGILERYFHLAEAGTSVRTEIMAGLTTFMTMAYILAVNPGVLSTTGMDAGAVFTATAVASSIATLVMALYARLPFALAPGMGLNAFFAYTVVLSMGHTWQMALTAVFLEGLIFLLLTATKLREAIVHCMPLPIKKAISGGIGLFVALIGFKNAGIVTGFEPTLVKLGDVTAPGPLVAFFGLAVTGVLLAKKVRGALLYGILAATAVGIPLGVTQIADFDASHLFSVPSLEPLLFKIQFHQILTFDMAVILFTFLFVDMFDTVGTLIGVSANAGMLDSKGQVPRARQALFADAVGTTLGSLLGTSTVTTYVESASGVAQGGRTGLTALTVAVLFMVSLLLAPIFLLIPAQATASALIVVGLFMLKPIFEINMDDFTDSIPAFLTIVLMPFTFSISEGIVFGILAYVALKLLTGRSKEIPALLYILALLFISRLVIQ
ncbi:NCS2 family permease [Desulfovibrio ferrophilus]|uniref:Integral membrane transport protein n=1 Tax=Desulfovibrio ferrophilus TaxID=241368 RepID=A0A2Z6B1V7_9BACT|nr:NCS2 family permease [Desulfovibrio ferrophilus]BBD09376.1 integral membrane transport protein [Desulfovibrio ferrophilus]